LYPSSLYFEASAVDQHWVLDRSCACTFVLLFASELEISQLVAKSFLGRYCTFQASSVTRFRPSAVVLDLQISSHRYHPNRPSATRIGPNHSLPAVARAFTLTRRPRRVAPLQTKR
jgi:hypothetical protein